MAHTVTILEGMQYIVLIVCSWLTVVFDGEEGVVNGLTCSPQVCQVGKKDEDAKVMVTQV